MIDAVHSYTDLNWWAAIVLTTLLIRSTTIPLLINQLKATSKLLLMRPHMEEIRQQMQDKGLQPLLGNSKSKHVIEQDSFSREFCSWSQCYCAIVNSLELEVLVFGWNLELIVGLFSHNNGTGFYSKSYLWFNCICNLLGIGSFPSCAISTHLENCRVPARCHAYGPISSFYSR